MGPSADSEAKRAARENGLRQEESNGQAEVEEEPEPETCTDQQQREAEAESPAEQTDRSYVEPQTPVESQNGNGHVEETGGAQTKRTLEETESAAAAPESKRPCTESVESVESVE